MNGNPHEQHEQRRVIREPVTSGMMVISGSFSEERAKAIVAALAPKKAAR